MRMFDRRDETEIGEDEPVFLIRASDAEGPNLLRKYAFLLRARHPGSERRAEEIEAFAETMFEWQHAEGNAAPPPAPEDPPPPRPSSPGSGSPGDSPSSPVDPGPSRPEPERATPAIPAEPTGSSATPAVPPGRGRSR